MTQEKERILEIIDLAEAGQVQLAFTSSQGRRPASPVTFSSDDEKATFEVRLAADDQ